MSYETKEMRDTDRSKIETHEMIQKELARISDQVTEVTAGVRGKQGELQARLLEVEQKMARRGGGGGNDPGSDGGGLRQLIEGSQALKDFAERKSRHATLELPADFMERKATITSPGLVYPEQMPGIVTPVTRRMTIRKLLPSIPVTSGAVQYIQETGYTNAAATVSETTQKPFSDLTFLTKMAYVAVIAHLLKLSLQALQDTPLFSQYVDNRMRYGLEFATELQLLKGSGVGSNIQGLMTAATAFTGSTSGTQIDVLRRAMTQLEATEYQATGVVLNPQDWENIELLKNTLGNYITDGPSEPVGPDSDALWSLPIVVTNAMTAGTFLVADFPQSALLLDRMQPMLLVANENVDDFEKNLATARLEQRLGLAILRPGGLIRGTFA